MKHQHIVCFSGGVGSALVAIEVYRRHGNADLVLLNHDIHESVEDADIKRFKREVATCCGIDVTYANMEGWDRMDQFDVSAKARAFHAPNRMAICTNRLKTDPFDRWLAKNAPPGDDCTIYYGFGPDEADRIQRRRTILGARGYATAYPLAEWPRTIADVREVGIEPPLGYAVFKHANCTGCIKAGMQHWYVVYCVRPDLWAKAVATEAAIGHTIVKGKPLVVLADRFERMKEAGIVATEHVPAGRFWADVRSALGKGYGDGESGMPCECVT